MDGAGSDVEMAVVGLGTREQVDAWVLDAAQSLLGEPVRSILFRSGRIDAVYGLRSGAGTHLLLKVHRPPADLEGRRLVARAQQLLADSGFPCARPLAPPSLVDGRLVSIETLLPDGERADGHDRRVRAAVARGLAEQVTLFVAHPELVAAIGRPPAWCDYTGGAWGFTHDPVFDFRTTPSAYDWLRGFAQDAADVLNAASSVPDDRPRVAAHADWHCGNLRFDGSRLVAAFDWDLFADSEAVVAGITAGMYSSGTSPTATPPTPQDAAQFLRDYEYARELRFDESQCAVAGAAVRWSIAYTARCDVTQLRGRPPALASALGLLSTRRSDYADLRW